MKDVLCPIHHIPLKLRGVHLEAVNRDVVVGTCSKCQVRYMDRQLFQSNAGLKIAGIQYEFLPGLYDAVTKEKERERKRREAEEREREQKRREQELKQRKEKEEKRRLEHQAKEQEEELRRSYLQNPDKPFRTNNITYYKKEMTHCWYDNSELVLLNNVGKIGTNQPGTPHLCCLTCYRMFAPESEKYLHKKQSVVNHRKEYYLTEQEAIRFLEPKKKKRKKNVEINNTQDPIMIAQVETVSKKEEVEKQTVTIVKNKNGQDTKRGIYWIGQRLPSLILAALLTDPKKEFKAQGRTYRVTEYQTFSSTSKYVKIFSKFYDAVIPQTIFVFSQKSVSTFNSQNYECVTAMVLCARSQKPVPVEVYYEKDTHRYFINEVSYQLLREKYGFPYLHIKMAHDLPGIDLYETMQKHSELYLLGYNVNETNGLSRLERHRILREIVNNGIMTKAEVQSHIEWLIHTRGHMATMAKAVIKWKDDLQYVFKLSRTGERTICVGNFVRRL